MPRATARSSAAPSAKKSPPAAIRVAAAKKAPAAAKGAAPAKKPPTKAAAAKKTVAARKPAAKQPAVNRKAPAKKGAKVDKFVLGQKAILLEERSTYLRQAESLRAEADLLAAEREPGDVQFDEESGEGDTLAVERERDLALSAQASAAVEEIDAALARIQAGIYGVCVQCGQAIPRERLRALPFAALCVRCKSGGLGRRPR